MHFDIDKMAALGRFELLLGTVVPRPIALVTTLGEDGTLNSAPEANRRHAGAKMVRKIV